MSGGKFGNSKFENEDTVIKFKGEGKLKNPKYCNCKEIFVTYEKDCDDCNKVIAEEKYD